MKSRLRNEIRTCIWIVIAGLTVSGITAFPIQAEMDLLIRHSSGYPNTLKTWLLTVHNSVVATNNAYPFLSYGTDWLAFAHLMLAVLFIGPLRNPVKNRWVIEFGIIACIAIFPLAFIAGGIRGIPFFWRLIDCSFGVIGLIPLVICLRCIKELEDPNRGFS